MPEKTDTKPDSIVTDPGGSTDEVLREAGLRALQAEREAVKNLKAELKALKDEREAEETKKLSEAEKWKKKFDEASAKLATMERKAEVEKLRATVAEQAGIAEYADLLAGDDEESLKAHAERLKAALGPKTPDPNPFLADGQNQNGDGDQAALSVLGFGG